MIKNITPDSNFVNGMFTLESTSNNSGYSYPELCHYYYPTYYNYCTTYPNRIESAFKIVNILIEKKLVDLKKIKDFVELVNEISKVI